MQRLAIWGRASIAPVLGVVAIGAFVLGVYTWLYADNFLGSYFAFQHLETVSEDTRNGALWHVWWRKVGYELMIVGVVIAVSANLLWPFKKPRLRIEWSD